MKFSCVIRGGTIIDGTGAPAFPASLGIDNGRICAIARGADLDGETIIDAKGKVVAPGFIDFHSHSEWVLPSQNHRNLLTPFMLQGVTTLVGGNCGFSPFPVRQESQETVLENSRSLAAEDFAYRWGSASEFFEHLAERGICLNAASCAGHGTLRAYSLGNQPRLQSRAEREEMYRLARRCISEGALGVSLGLAYVPGIFADEEELEGLCAAVAIESGIVTVHGRTYSRTSAVFPETEDDEAHNVRDIRFFLELAKRTGVRLHLSHVLLKGRNTWPVWPQVLDAIEDAHRAGVDVSFGVIPYHWGNTIVTTLLPKWFLEDLPGNLRSTGAVERLKREIVETERAIGRDMSDLTLQRGMNPDLARYEGKNVDAIARETGMLPIDAFLMLVKGSGGKAKILTAGYSGKDGENEEPLRRLLSHPLALAEIDTVITSPTGPHSPATYGAFPKLIGQYAREAKLFGLEAAVRKVTGLAADRARLKEVGYLREGYHADIVVFDPLTISARNSLTDPDVPSDGIERVLISGISVVDKGVLVSDGVHGRVLRHGA